MVMIKRNIKFPLEMKNGVKVRTLEELKANYDIERILDYYFNGKLKVWLEQRYYVTELEKLEELSALDEREIPQKLCSIFEINFSDESKFIAEMAIKRRKKIDVVKQYTEDMEIIENIDFVATSQDELESILSKDNLNKRVYLLGEQFIVDDRIEKVEYIGINQPTMKLIAKERFDAKKRKISFKNVHLTSDLEIKLNAEQNLYKINTLDKKIKAHSGFERLKKVIDLVEMEHYDDLLHFFAKKVFVLENYIVIYTDYRPAKIILFESKTGKVNKEIVKQNKSIPAIWKHSPNELLYYYSAEWGQDFSSLIKLDSEIIEKVAIRDFYVNSTFYQPDIIGIYNGKVYSYQLKSTYEYSKSRTFLYFRSYEINSGKEIEQGRFELPFYYYHNKLSSIKHYFYKGNLYLYLPNQQMLITDENKQIKLETAIQNFIICNDKIIAIAENQDFFHQTRKGDLLLLDLDTGKKISQFKAHNQEVEIIKQFNDRFVTMTGEGEIKIWNSDDLSLISTIHLPKDDYYTNIYDVDLSEERMAVLYDGKIFIYES